MSKWKTYKLGEISQIIGRGTPSTTIGDIGWITPRDLTGYTNKFISNGERLGAGFGFFVSVHV